MQDRWADQLASPGTAGILGLAFGLGLEFRSDQNTTLISELMRPSLKTECQVKDWVPGAVEVAGVTG